MAQNVYECMFILDANRYARDPNNVAGTIPQMVEKCGGEMLASRLYNEQKLAYPINGQRKGAYWLSYFRMEGESVAKFNRECQLNNFVLRNLTLKIDSRLVDALVSHASGETKPAAEGDSSAAAESTDAAETTEGDSKPAEPAS